MTIIIKALKLSQVTTFHNVNAIFGFPLTKKLNVENWWDAFG